MNLLSATPGTEYIIQRIETNDEELDAFREIMLEPEE